MKLAHILHIERCEGFRPFMLWGGEGGAGEWHTCILQLFGQHVQWFFVPSKSSPWPFSEVVSSHLKIYRLRQHPPLFSAGSRGGHTRSRQSFSIEWRSSGLALESCFGYVVYFSFIAIHCPDSPMFSLHDRNTFSVWNKMTLVNFCFPKLLNWVGTVDLWQILAKQTSSMDLNKWWTKVNK